MNAQHTKGPWHTPGEAFMPMERGHRADTYRAFGIGNGASHVGYASITSAQSADEALANARLIAAAPELLEALELAVATIERLAPVHGPFNSAHARNAIAKAKGGM